jgi:UDP-N-acetylmuramate--alanine ligase
MCDYMFKIDFTKPLHMHFIGIGGISMSGFAQLLHTLGFKITGSDTKQTQITNHLESIGITVFYGQRSSNITSDIDLIVYTAAINKENLELIAAISSGIPMLDRAEMIGQVMKNYESAIAVSGTHGKTTTTSMIAHILLSANFDPTISVGGILKAIDGNLRIGKSNTFLTEACEYTNSFLKFNPTIGVILNVEEDHMDFFKNIDDIRHSFHLFSQKIPNNGILVINGEINHYDDIVNDLSCKVVTYGLLKDSFDFSAKNITFDEFGCGQFDLFYRGKDQGRIFLHVLGVHNISNALAAIALAFSLNISIDNIQNGLSSFTGTNRRFEHKGEIGGITVIDDYAHHPTEIEATLTSVKNYPHKTTWCVFQPHTYTRTRAFLKEFAQALSLADKVVLTDIYAAREKDPGDISSKDLKRELELLGKEVYYSPSFDDIEIFLLQNCVNGDLLITMGAGDVVMIGESLLGS